LNTINSWLLENLIHPFDLHVPFLNFHRAKKLIGIGCLTQFWFEGSISFHADCVGEECHGYIHRAELFALTTIDAGIRDVGKTPEVEH
jgi:hypothetical protein